MNRKPHEIAKPFEFLLKINGNIICQRYFNIKNYNPNCRESLEIKDMMDEVMGTTPLEGIIPNFFKVKCVNNLWENYNPNYNKQRFDNTYNKEDIFTFEVLINKELATSASFDGSVFQSNVRRNIDIRLIIPSIIKAITNCMSLDEYTKDYGDVKLRRHNNYKREGINIKEILNER